MGQEFSLSGGSGSGFVMRLQSESWQGLHSSEGFTGARGYTSITHMDVGKRFQFLATRTPPRASLMPSWHSIWLRPEWERVIRERECYTCYDLTSKATLHHFGNILLVTQSSPILRGWLWQSHFSPQWCTYFPHAKYTYPSPWLLKVSFYYSIIPERSPESHYLSQV